MADGVVKVFDWPDLGLIHELRSGKEMISTLKFSPDSKLLVSSGKDKLTIWNCIENYK